MPAKGIERVRRGYRVAVAEIAGGTTEQAVYEILSQVGAMANLMAPMDTSTLVNSQYAPQIEQRDGKTTGSIGYTAEYAAAVHDAPGTLRGMPRDPNDPSRGDFWDPNAEPGFLTKGGDQVQPAVPAILKRHYQV